MRRAMNGVLMVIVVAGAALTTGCDTCSQLREDYALAGEAEANPAATRADRQYAKARGKELMEVMNRSGCRP